MTLAARAGRAGAVRVPRPGERRGRRDLAGRRRDHVREAVDRARLAAQWWADLGFDGRRERLLAWKGVLTRRVRELAQLVHRENGKPVDDAILEILLAIDHVDWSAKHARKVLGPRTVRPSLLSLNQQALAGVPAARRRRRHRPVELPGVHPDGLDRVRAGRGQRRRVQAVRAHPGHRRMAGRRVRRGGARAAGPAAGDRGRRDRCRAVPLRRRQDRVHRLVEHRASGHGRVRRDAHPGAHRVRRQGRPDRRRRRRPGRGRRRRGLGRAGQRRADLRRHRARLRRRLGVRRLRPAAGRADARAAPRQRRRGVVRPDHPTAAGRRHPPPRRRRPRPRRASGRRGRGVGASPARRPGPARSTCPRTRWR